MLLALLSPLLGQAAPSSSPVAEIPNEIAALTPEQRTLRLRAAVTENDRLAEVTALLAGGADPLHGLREGQPSFLIAIEARHPDYAEAMLAAQPDLCAKPWPDPYTRVTVGMVALYEALSLRLHPFALRLLTREHVKPIVWRPRNDETTPTALGHAVVGWNAEIVRRLVETGARFDYLPAGEGFFSLLEDYGIRRPTPEDIARDRKFEESKAKRETATLERLRQKITSATTPEAKTRAKAVLRRHEEFSVKTREQDREWNAKIDPLNKIRLLASFRAPGSPKAATGVNDERIDGATPLSIAVARNWPEVVVILVAGGANPRIGQVENRSILEYVADKPDLLRALSGIAPSTEKSVTPIADGAAFIAAIAKNDVAFLRDTPLSAELIAYRDPKGWSLLHHAIKQHDDALALRWIAAGADIEATTASGQTPLTFAGFNARPEVARALLAKKANPQAPVGGLPPLAGACVGNSAEIVRMLLAADADPRATYDGGVPLILCAAQHSSPEIVRLLLERGASLKTSSLGGTGPLEVTFFQDNADTLAWMLDHGTRWQSAARSEQTGPLLEAVRHRAWRCAHVLLQRGELDPRALPLATNPEFKAALEDKLQASGSTALNDAELWPAICDDRENWKTRVDAHLAKGGDINYAGSNWTPLLKAFYAGNIDLVRYLVAKGADPKKHPSEQMYADMITLAHLYQGTFGKPAHQTIPEFLTYRAELVRLLAPLEPSSDYEHYLSNAINRKNWREVEAYVAIGTPTESALGRIERMPNLNAEQRELLRTLLTPR